MTAMNLTWRQQSAISCLALNGGEACEGTVDLEGFNARRTLRSLERRGYVVRGEYRNASDGYVYRIAPGYFAAPKGDE